LLLNVKDKVRLAYRKVYQSERLWIQIILYRGCSNQKNLKSVVSDEISNRRHTDRVAIVWLEMKIVN